MKRCLATIFTSTLLGLAAVAIVNAASSAKSAEPPETVVDRTWSFSSGGGVGEVAVSRVIGTLAVGLDGDRVGVVEDMLVDGDGRPVAVLLRVGWYFGVPTRTVAVPIALVHFRKGKDPSTAAKGVPRGGRTTDRASLLDELMEGGGGKAVRQGTDGEHVEIALTRRQLLEAPAFTRE
jgi:hypothetical protein